MAGQPNDISNEIKKAIPALLIVGILAVLIYFWKSFYIQLEDYEKALVLRLGSLSERQLHPGPNWRLPYPIEDIYVVDVVNDKKLQIGFRESASGEKSHIEGEALTLTRFGNLVDLEMEINYYVSNPADYLLKAVDPDNSIRQIAESAMRMVVGLHTIDETLTEKKREIVEEIKKKAQTLIDSYELGVIVRRVQFVKAVNPAKVMDAFQDVENAKQDSGKAYLDAQKYANQIIPEARGNAQKTIEKAKGYATSITARAEGDSTRFSLLLDKYLKYKTVTRKRLYLETMDEVLPKVKKVIVDPSSNTSNFLPLKKF